MSTYSETKIYRVQFSWNTGTVTYYLHDVPRRGDYVDLNTYGAGAYNGEVIKVEWLITPGGTCNDVLIELG